MRWRVTLLDGAAGPGARAAGCGLGCRALDVTTSGRKGSDAHRPVPRPGRSRVLALSLRDLPRVPLSPVNARWTSSGGPAAMPGLGGDVIQGTFFFIANCKTPRDIAPAR